MIKKIATVLVVIIALFLTVGLVLPSSYEIQRTVEIEKPPAMVFEQVADFNNWLDWNPWTEMEPTAKNEISGPQGAPGARWAWEGEEIGSGSLTLKEIESNTYLESEVVFKAPMESTAADKWEFESTGSSTKVTWISSGELAYPVGRYFGLAIDGMLGPQMEKGLANLKTLVESMPEPTPPTEGEPEGEPSETGEGAKAPKKTTSLL